MALYLKQCCSNSISKVRSTFIKIPVNRWINEIPKMILQAI